MPKEQTVFVANMFPTAEANIFRRQAQIRGNFVSYEVTGPFSVGQPRGYYTDISKDPYVGIYAPKGKVDQVRTRNLTPA